VSVLSESFFTKENVFTSSFLRVVKGEQCIQCPICGYEAVCRPHNDPDGQIPFFEIKSRNAGLYIDNEKGTEEPVDLFICPDCGGVITSRGNGKTANRGMEKQKKDFLEAVISSVDYWSTLPGKTIRDRCYGIAFSILAEIDGEGGTGTPYDLIPLDEKGEPASNIAGSLHGEFYELEREERSQ
jgi:predicted RNA-binding Zn-ribbon protein involved in translation (DUF1610 family)